MFILRNYQSDTASLQSFENQTEIDNQPQSDDDYRITQAGDLLELYVKTDNNAPLMVVLKQVREFYLDDLDLVNSAAEVTGLLVWLMDDYGLDGRGESLEQTADRLSDLDIEDDTDKYTDLIFHLKDAVERLYDLEMDEW
ncbi:hypothetical protein IOQ59_07600 [Pontibacterium sp. N1Y112]|uniref:Uncharacterized protein n=1 Tax=Pontibacterium sinense TaxID=2781979 RepID=A0A8J7JZ15_9GAMM|nr:hypothetical protein [Pontibacterium sinense]MBE9397124.1 hypothetical protein [Pontibacterium sinense]